MGSRLLKGQWVKAREKIPYRWTALTAEDVSKIDGDRDALVAKVENTYRLDRNVAEMQVADFERTLKVG
jgi:hypothetical protein